MITVLQHQQVCKRRKTHVQNAQKQNRKKIASDRGHANTTHLSIVAPRRRHSGNGKRSITVPLISGIVLLLVCLFISSPHIFSLTFQSFSSALLELPQESHLSDYPDGHEYVKSLMDEREFGIITINQENRIQDRNKEEYPAHYIVQKGDSVYSISKKYDISLYDLLRENRITDAKKLKIGDILTFPTPSYKNQSLRDTVKNGNTLPGDIVIKADTTSGTTPVKVSFSLKSITEQRNSPDNGNDEIHIGYSRAGLQNRPTTPSVKTDDDPLTYMWVLGNDTYHFNKEVEFTYIEPGTYHAFLIVSDSMHREVVSNTITIEVKKKHPRKLSIESTPQYYMTVNQVNDIINITTLTGLKKEEITGVDIRQTPRIFQAIDDYQLLSIGQGYSKLTITIANKQFTSHLFVSPLPSVHSYEPPYNWYKTQFATGINGNCGPAVVAMAIHWANGADIPVAKVRSEIGLPFKNGAINFPHMFPSFRKHLVKADYTYINKPGDINKIIDHGNIAIVVFNTRHISTTKGDPAKNLIGRYYNDTVGHYCIIKGYTPDGKYYIVYDPIPSDWTTNSIRYADGTSMLGKNRYYPVSELYRSMDKKVIEIKR